jgi:uncharacterized protein with HEPN domain
MVEAVDRIEAYLAGLDRAGFLDDPRTQDAVVRNLEIIGEAAQAIRQRYPDVIEAHPEVPWRSAWGMRNALMHGYFTVDLDRVWRTVQDDLPSFRQIISTLVSGLG